VAELKRIALGGSLPKLAIIEDSRRRRVLRRRDGWEAL